MRINPNSPILGFFSGALSAIGARKQQQDALQFQTDARQFEQEDAYRQSLPAEYNAATRSPWFQSLSPEQQTAYGEELSKRAGRYGDRIIPVGSRIGTRTTLAPTGSILQGPPSPAQSADMASQGVDRPSGGYLEYAQTPSQTVLPAYKPPVKTQTLADRIAAARFRASLTPESQTAFDGYAAGGDTNAPLPPFALAPPATRPQSPEQIAHLRATDQAAYLRGEQPAFDAAATTTLPQKIATMQAANKQREALGLPALPVVGDVIGYDPNRQIEGPRPENAQGPGNPTPAPIVAQFPRSAQLQAKNADAASKAKQTAATAAAKSRQQAETERQNKQREKIQRDGIAAGLTKAQISAKLAEARLDQSAEQFDKTYNLNLEKFKYQRSQPKSALGQVTPAQTASRAHSDRVRQQKSVEGLTRDRDDAQKTANRLEGLIANGINPKAAPRVDKDTGQINPADKNGVRYTEGELVELRRQFRAAEDEAARVQALIDQAKAGMGYKKPGTTSRPPVRRIDATGRYYNAPR